jgi:hypothetical protein
MQDSGELIHALLPQRIGRRCDYGGGAYAFRNLPCQLVCAPIMPRQEAYDEFCRWRPRLKPGVHQFALQVRRDSADYDACCHDAD